VAQGAPAHLLDHCASIVCVVDAELVSEAAVQQSHVAPGGGDGGSFACPMPCIGSGTNAGVGLHRARRSKGMRGTARGSAAQQAHTCRQAGEHRQGRARRADLGWL